MPVFASVYIFKLIIDLAQICSKEGERPGDRKQGAVCLPPAPPPAKGSRLAGLWGVFLTQSQDHLL